MRSKIFLVGLFVCITLGDRFSIAGSDNIDVALTESVPFLMQKLKEKGIKCAGVLPFRMRQGGKPEEMTGALIQSNIAIRIEQALTVYRDPDQPVNIVFGMLEQARRTSPKAEYLTTEGRKNVFTNEYELPVGSERSKVDAFVTGLVDVSKDWSETKIFYEYCLASDPAKVNKSGPFFIKTDRKMLASMGKGFSVSRKGSMSRSISSALVMQGVVDDENFQIQEDKASGFSDPNQRVGKPVASDPWQRAPVTLTVKYDNQNQGLLKDSVAGRYNFAIADPKAGQRVSFELKNNTAKKVGVVLSVNGKSLLYSEYAANPEDISKFVLEPNKTYSVAGVYQKDHKGIQPVLGISDDQTNEVAKSLPTDAVGLIHMYVFETVQNEPGEKKVDEKKIDEKKVDEKKVDEKKVDEKKVDERKVNERKVDEKKVDEKKADEGGHNPFNEKQIGGTFVSDGIEQWQTGFNFSLARDAGNGKKTKANGSFNPREFGEKANTWDELMDRIAHNLMTSASGSRGLILPQGGIENQIVQTLELGPVQQTDVVIIRYLSVAKD